MDSIGFFLEQSQVNYKTFSKIDIDVNYIYERNQEIKRWKINKEIQRLKQKHMIDITKQGKRAILSLSKNGEISQIKRIITNTTNELPPNQKCYILFDIPETTREVRNKFRWTICNLGFIKEQQSVWCSTKNIVREISHLIHIAKLEKWVKILVASEIN